jgi:tRNA dimethylallyltransferase
MAPLIVITGPTASGKSRLALELAERYRGEIICADSRTVYIGMDIGTAKPSSQDQARVPHHLLDVVKPGERFTAGEFQARARQVIEAIRARGNVPFLVGGTGLYIDSVVLNYRFDDTPVDETERRELEQLSAEQLQTLLKKHHIDLPENRGNKRHLIRAREQRGINISRQNGPDDNTYVVAITTDSTMLNERIRDRASDMFAAGVLDEARALGEKYGWESEAMTGNIYPILRQVLEGLITQDEAIELIAIRDRQLVKRQLTWLKRHDYVRWLSISDARNYISSVLDAS